MAEPVFSLGYQLGHLHKRQVGGRSPSDAPEQLGDVPTPNLIRAAGQQLGFLIMGMAELIATLAHLPGLLQDSVHRANRAQVGALVQPSGKDLGRRLVAEAL